MKIKYKTGKQVQQVYIQLIEILYKYYIFIK